MKGEHMQNKKSIWSTLLLVATLLMLASAVISIVTTIVTLPEIMEAAKEIAKTELASRGYTISEEALDMAMNTARTAAVMGLVFATLIAGLEVLGGLLFSLKGKWGIFCIVVGVLGIIGGFTNVFSSTASTVVTNIIGLLVSGLFCVSSVMHYRENKQLRDEETI